MVSSMDETWTETTDVYEENSMGTTRTARKLNLTFNVYVGGKLGSRQFGSFEWYSDDEEWYCSGGLWFTDGELIDYDGCFSLCSQVIRRLHEHGFDVESVAKSCAPKLHKRLYPTPLEALQAATDDIVRAINKAEGEEE